MSFVGLGPSFGFCGPGCSLEWMMLKLKLQYVGHLMWRVDSLEKTDAGRDWGQEEKGTTEDEMAGWHHQLDGLKSEWTPGVGDGQGGLTCCNSWDCKESDTTEWLNWTELKRSPQRNSKKLQNLSCLARTREILTLLKVCNKFYYSFSSCTSSAVNVCDEGNLLLLWAVLLTLHRVRPHKFLVLLISLS